MNDSENARKARAVLDQTIQTLGGDAYLTFENRSEVGRYYPLYHGRTDSTGIPYRYYVEYPDKTASRSFIPRMCSCSLAA
jgi:hypothetical protein